MFTGKRVMIVEDSKTIIHQVKLIVEQNGVNLVEAGSEWGMFKKIEEYGKFVDLIIMDLILKFENGLDLIEKLKTDDKYKDIPILILTEQADAENVLRAKELGIKYYLRKPIEKDKLLERMTMIFNK
ncbi:response regulator [Clostridium sp. JNZ J1-5]